MTGLFASRGHNQGSSIYQAQRRLERERFLDLFAERLSKHGPRDPGGDIARCAASLGKSAAWGRQQFRIICDRLGWQAC